MFGSFDHCGWKAAHKKQIHRQNPKFGSEFSQALGHVAKNHKRQRLQMGKALEYSRNEMGNPETLGTPQRGERERSKSLGKSRALGGQNVPVIPVGYLCTHCVHLKLESDGIV